MLGSVDWQLVTDVSGKHIRPIYKDQAVQFGLIYTAAEPRSHASGMLYQILQKMRT
jgi:hypothetical protein